MRDGQEQIRDDYVTVAHELSYHEDKITELEQELTELQARCTHPNLGAGENPDGMEVEPNECPDCGFIKEG